MATASASYEPKRPPIPNRSMVYNIPRSKTPSPVVEKLYSAELSKHSRTPPPHEEDLRHRRRTTGTTTSARAADQVPRRAHAGATSRSNISPNGNEPKWKNSDTLFNLNAEKQSKPAEQQYTWANLAFDVDLQVQFWIIEEETRRIAAAQEAERTRLVQEEVRRIQAKILMKHEYERLRMLEEMRLMREEDERDHVQRQKTAADRIMANAWTIYERNWAVISSSSEALSFSSIPWPTLSRPSGPSSITLPAVSTFLLSEAHSTSQKPKERIKEALRRWHPDRFVRFLRRVPEEERSTVEEAVGIVTRCLNELLSKYSDEK